MYYLLSRDLVSNIRSSYMILTDNCDMINICIYTWKISLSLSYYIYMHICIHIICIFHFKIYIFFIYLYFIVLDSIIPFISLSFFIIIIIVTITLSFIIIIFNIIIIISYIFLLSLLFYFFPLFLSLCALLHAENIQYFHTYYVL